MHLCILDNALVRDKSYPELQMLQHLVHVVKIFKKSKCLNIVG